MSSWKIWVDTGGTFTDCLALDPDGQVHRLKILSNGTLRGRITRQISPTLLKVDAPWPQNEDIYRGYEIRITAGKELMGRLASVDAKEGLVELQQPIGKLSGRAAFELCADEEVPVFAARLMTKTPLHRGLPPIEMKLGSTKGTNAILERKGASTALLVTKGFADLLEIGNQQRPDLFALHIQKPRQLYELVFEIDERIDASGNILRPWNERDGLHLVKTLKKRKIKSVAVALMNSYANPVHEGMVKKVLLNAGFSSVSVSSELSGQVKILPRAQTAVANAYLSPVVKTYVDRVKSGGPGIDLKVMTSAGGLIRADSFHPKDSLLSGPAGGVVGAAITARLSGHDRLITFDMGGTSTDVSLYDRRFDYRYESRIGSFRILSPSLAIETIAAGGGSICSFDGSRLLVGPESAGALPGPACYGMGGPLTITDVNLLLGRLDPRQFAIPLTPEDARSALQALRQKMRRSTGRSASEKKLLLSLLQIANEKMAEAIRRVSTHAGHNPADFMLLSFGGAGGQHACSLATLLSIRRILIPYDAGLLSAFGIGHAQVERFEEKLVLLTLKEAAGKLPALIDQLLAQGRDKLVAEGYDRGEVVCARCLAFLRFEGQENVLEIQVTPSHFSADSLHEDFKDQYRNIFGHWLEHREVELESLRVVAAIPERPVAPQSEVPRRYSPAPLSQLESLANEDPIPTYNWEVLLPGAFIDGPALVVSNNSTTVVDDGWNFTLDANNNAALTNKATGNPAVSPTKEAELELFSNRLTAIAKDMGALLQRTSFSVNVKERLDFSCAVLDSSGSLIVNAPHIPVHLGSLGVCVREVVKKLPVRHGDVILTNHPAYGGSHLPDVTLIKPVFCDGKRVAYVANRAHHAEIGGVTPGSMPAHASRLVEEGVVIAPMYLLRGGQPEWEAVEQLFSRSPYPTRSWNENRADLNGALAAVNLGEKALLDMCLGHGVMKVTGYMKRLRMEAARLLVKRLDGLPVARLSAHEQLDDGSILSATLQKKKAKLIVDFTGSSGIHPGNLNATVAIVQSVVLYVLRILVGQPIPLNEGLMDAVDLILPQGMLNPDFSDPSALPAVVGGNTEVSQRLTDTLIKALRLAACSQGTMNNFLFGNDKFGYYETICGGTGAGRGFAGADAVHQHMTNTRITDPEILELRYPVRLERFSIRKNSGGRGKWNGGAGVVREFLFNAALEVNILSQHRKERPYGLMGGFAGKAGTQRIVRKDGAVMELRGMDSARIFPGDRLIIETPGGGGVGKP